MHLKKEPSKYSIDINHWYKNCASLYEYSWVCIFYTSLKTQNHPDFNLSLFFLIHTSSLSPLSNLFIVVRISAIQTRMLGMSTSTMRFLRKH